MMNTFKALALSALCALSFSSDTSHANSKWSDNCDGQEIVTIEAQDMAGEHQMDIEGPQGEPLRVVLNIEEVDGQFTITNSKLYRVENKNYRKLSYTLITQSAFDPADKPVERIQYVFGGFFEPESRLSLRLSPDTSMLYASADPMDEGEAGQFKAEICTESQGG